jgi:hypothetical protein
MFYYKIYLIIQKIKVKFLVGENKYVCGYYKVIWMPSPKCNTHIQMCFRYNPQVIYVTWGADPILNAIPTCRVISK